MPKLELLSYKELNKIIDEALREHYRESWECKRVPSDYLVMFTEGGESNAVADAIAKAQLAKDQKAI
jgi:phosphoserine aminotransferase